MRKITIFWGIILAWTLFIFLISLYKVNTVSEGVDDCMQAYVQKLPNIYSGKGVWQYSDIYGTYHISEELEENFQKIGLAKGCFIFSENHIYFAYVNSIYCLTSYFLKK